MFKTNNEIISIEAKATDPIPTGVVFWSHDKGTAKMIFRLQKENVNQTLSEGTIIPILLEFLSATAENGRGRHIYHAIIEDAINGIVSIVLEDNILGYQGKVDGSIYIELPDKRSLDTAGRFSFEIKRSPIDEKVPELEDYYWQGFNEIMESYHQTIAGIKSEAKELLDSLTADVTTVQNELTNLNARIDEISKKIDDNDVYTKAESSANVIYQLIGKEKVRITFKADFINKLAGSLIENVNISKRSSAGNGSPIRLLSLEEFGIEVNQGGYDLFSQLDSKLYNLQATNSGGIIQEVFSYNVVEIVKHELGEQFFIDRGASKVSEQSQVIREIAVDDRANIWAYGSGASGNKVTVGVWSYRSSNWQGLLSHSKNVITKVSRPTGNLKDYLGDDGFMNYITFAEASDGTTPSSINVDYSNFELTIEVSANEHIKSMIAHYHRENLATQEEAESGESDEKSMTPLATKQSIEKRSVLLAGDQDLDGKKNFLVMPTVGGKEFLTTDDLPITAALWLGASFLSAAHTLSLSKNIADCASGIALKFNPYNTSSGSSYTSQTSWCIIPKHHVLGTASGQNTFCPIYKQDGTFVGAKVITVSPTKIVGADVNAVGVLYEYVLTGVYEV